MSSVVLSGNTSGAVTLSVPDVAGTNTATLPAATGTVMVSGNMPAFSAYQASSQSVSNSTATKVTFDTEEFDTNNNFASSRFTPTVAGYYQINANVAFSFSAGLCLADIFKNGSLYKYGNFTSGTAIGASVSTSSLVYMNGTTDYLEIFVFQLSGTSQNTNANSYSTWFNGSLVRAA